MPEPKVPANPPMLQLPLLVAGDVSTVDGLNGALRSWAENLNQWVVETFFPVRWVGAANFVPPEPVINLGDAAPYVKTASDVRAESLPCNPLVSPRPEWLPADAAEQLLYTIKMDNTPEQDSDEILDLITHWYNENKGGQRRATNAEFAFHHAADRAERLAKDFKLAIQRIRLLEAERDKAIQERDSVRADFNSEKEGLDAAIATLHQIEEILIKAKLSNNGRTIQQCVAAAVRERDEARAERDKALLSGVRIPRIDELPTYMATSSRLNVAMEGLLGTWAKDSAIGVILAEVEAAEAKVARVEALLSQSATATSPHPPKVEMWTFQAIREALDGEK